MIAQISQICKHIWLFSFKKCLYCLAFTKQNSLSLGQIQAFIICCTPRLIQLDHWHNLKIILIKSLKLSFQKSFRLEEPIFTVKVHKVCFKYFGDPHRKTFLPFPQFTAELSFDIKCTYLPSVFAHYSLTTFR